MAIHTDAAKHVQETQRLTSSPNGQHVHVTDCSSIKHIHDAIIVSPACTPQIHAAYRNLFVVLIST